MKKNVKSVLAIMVAVSMLLPTVSFAAVGERYNDVGKLQDSLNYAPYADTQATSKYAPWLKMIHFTTENEYKDELVGGEACQQIRAIAASADGKTVLAGTDTNGIWRTENGGTYWYNVGGFDYQYMLIQDIMFSKKNPTEAYMVSAASDGAKYTNDGLYKSTDSGKTWNHVLNTLYGKQYVDNLIAEDANGRIYTISSEGVFASADDGWSTLYSNTSGALAHSIAVSSDGTKIFAGYDDGLRISGDSGATWTSAADVSACYCVDINPIDSSICASQTVNGVYGVYKSADNGSSWSLLSGFEGKKVLNAGFAKTSDTAARYYVYLNEKDSPFRYTDNGTDWVVPTFNRSDAFQNSYSGYYRQGFDVLSDGTVYCSMGGMFKSSDFGTNFSWAGSGLSGLNVNNVAQGSDGTAYFSCVDIGVVGLNGKYTQKGVVPTVSRKSSQVMSLIACDPTDSNRVIAFGNNKNIMLSTDGGQTFEAKQECTSTQTFIKFNKDNSNVVMTNDYTSTDCGTTWTANASKISAVSDVDSNICWKTEGTSASDVTVSVSSDGGANWTELTKPQFKSRGIMAADVADKNVAYLIGEWDIAKYNAADGTVTKFNAASGALAGAGVFTFAQNPNNPKHMLIGEMSSQTAKGAGVRETTDGGVTWHPVKGIPGSRSIYYIAFSKTTDEAFFGSCNGLLAYDYNEYAKYFNTVSFSGGDGSVGTAPAGITDLEGTEITLPENTFVKSGCDFAGWSDGTKTYQPGDAYTVPASSITLSAVWNYSGKVTLPVMADYAALTAQQSPDTNAINTSPSGYDNISVKSGDNRYLWYKFDASDIAGKAFDKAELTLMVDRNSSGNVNVVVYKAKSDWDPKTICYNNQPNTEDTSVNREATRDECPDGRFSVYTLDISSIIGVVSESDPYIRIKVASGTWANAGTKVKGVYTSDAAKIVVTGVREIPKLTFVGGDGAQGTMPTVAAESGTAVTLPESAYTKAGYSFAGWSDGTQTYQPGASYTMPDGGATLTAVWTHTGLYSLTITAENAAHVSSATPAAEDISTAANGTDGITGRHNDTSRTKQSLYYRVDASALAGKAIGSAKLRLYMSRNYNAYPTVSVYKVTQSWDKSKINYNNQPSAGDKPIFSRTFNTAATGGSDGNPFANGGAFAYIDLDITDAFDSVTESNSYVTVRVDGTVTSSDYTEPVFKVSGVNSANAPVVNFSGITDIAENGNFMLVSGSTAEPISSPVSGIIRCCAKVTVPEEGGAATAVAVTALYDSNGNMIKVNLEEPVALSSGNNIVYSTIDLSDVTIQSGYVLKLIVLDNIDSITPLTEFKSIVAQNQ